MKRRCSRLHGLLAPLIGVQLNRLGMPSEKDNIPQNLQELAQALTDKWDALPIEGINKPVDCMPRRLNALIRVRAATLYISD